MHLCKMLYVRSDYSLLVIFQCNFVTTTMGGTHVPYLGHTYWIIDL